MWGSVMWVLLLSVVSVYLLPVVAAGTSSTLQDRKGAFESTGKVYGGTGEAPERAEALIIPGKSIGFLRLGDPEPKFHTLFPDGPNQDFRPTYNADCGAVLHWVDINPDHPLALGVTALSRDGSITQIEAGMPKFHTKDGITWNSSPSDVKEHYPRLKSYEAIGTTSEAVGGRNLIFWMDMKRGLGFVFSYSRKSENWGVYKIVVFSPTGRFCPEGDVPTSDTWRELAPYSLDSPDRRASIRDGWPGL